MRITVQKQDGQVSVDGLLLTGVDVSALPGNATGLQWVDTAGILPDGANHHASGELYTVEAGQPVRISINTFAPYQSILDSFNGLKAAQVPA